MYSTLKEFAEKAEDVGDGLFVGNRDAKFRLPGLRIGPDKCVGKIPNTILGAQGGGKA